MSDENNTNEQENIKEETKKANDNNQVLKFAAIIVAIFLGTFAAVYTVVDLTMYKMGFQPFVTLTKEFEKVFDDDAFFIEQASPAPVKIENEKDKYVVTINLKNFDNNPDNINVSVENNGIKINGSLQKKSDNTFNENSFYQNVIFPNKIDENSVEKKIKKNKLVITIPFKE